MKNSECNDYLLFDSQVNFGQNYFGPTSDLDDYIKNTSRQTSKAIVIPTATHKLTLNPDEAEISCLWEYKSDLLFYKYIMTKNETISIRNPCSPYRVMNMKTLEKIIVCNKNQSRIKFYFCPKFHSHLDKPDDINMFITKSETVAVKIQGIATFTGPDNVPNWFIKMIKARNIPLLVHTHFFCDLHYDPERSPILNHLGNLNQPLNWILFGLKHDLKIYLAHGVRLCPYAASLVNKHENFLVGIGPDTLLNNEKHSLFHSCAPYLETLFTLINPRKLAYSTDFAWNIYERDKWSNFDWHSHVRIIEHLKANKLNHEIENVLYRNAELFFKL